MARNFKELSDALDSKMTPEELAVQKARVQHSIEQVRLAHIRRARELSQAALAAKLGTDQGSISRLEKQGDMYLNTLRSYVEGLGGQLELNAVLPDETVTLAIGDSLRESPGV